MSNFDKDDHFILQEKIRELYDIIDELSAENEERQLALKSAFRIIMRLMQIANLQDGITFSDIELELIDQTHQLKLMHFLEGQKPQLTLALQQKQNTSKIEYIDAQNTEYAKKLLEKAHFD